MTLCFQPDVLLQKTKEILSWLIQPSHYHSDTIVWKCCKFLFCNRIVFIHNVMNFFPLFYLFFRKRAREEEIEAAEKAKREREWQKNFEVRFPSSGITSQNQNTIPNSLNLVFFWTICQETRDGRVDSWRNFQAKGKKSKEKKNRTFLKPPKVKMEQREWCSDTELNSPSLSHKKKALCIFTSASAGSFVVHFTRHQDTRHTADVLVPTLTNVVLYSVFLMYIFVIHSQRSYLPRVRIEKKCIFHFCNWWEIWLSCFLFF